MKITWLPKNVDGSGMYRCVFPHAALNNAGFRCVIPPMALFNQQGQQIQLNNNQLPDGWLTCIYDPDYPDTDVYVFQMPLEETPFIRMKELQAKGKKVVIEIDDDYMHLDSAPYNPFERKPGSGVGWLHKCVQHADAVSVSTPSLKTSYRHLNKKVTVLPNRLNWDMWKELTPVYEQPWRRVRVGYMGRLEWHSADLDVIRPWFGKWLRANPHVEFVAAGDPKIHGYLGVPVEQQVSTDSVDFRHLELGFVTATFDIGLVPLARNKFNESKSYLKGTEYAACGIAAIATPTQQYRAWSDHSGAVLLADTAKEWRAALDELVGDPSRRKSLGAKARSVASQFTYANYVDEWIDFFYSVCPEAKPKLLWDPSDGDYAQLAGAGATA